MNGTIAELAQKYPWFSEVYERVSKMNVLAHDATHLERVCKNASLITENVSGLDKELIYYCILTKDLVGRNQTGKYGKEHAIELGKKAAESVSLFSSIPQRFREDPYMIRTVVTEAHNAYLRAMREENPYWMPQHKESAYLHDSNQLDTIGITGLIRAFSFGELVKRQPYLQEDFPVRLWKANNFVPDGTERSTTHFLTAKLVNLKLDIFTEEGKRIAEERIQHTLTALKFLEEELTNNKATAIQQLK